ncbi:TonB-dependent receptor domain-containing protein [Pseudomarimonas salicorniae]|uniref:TonB-dependent receptor n=1 Tax=Pseudomarimonas salicorniae TaxID=2933270 RepID=A0ABT0GEU0_9GAMM|nr:TonB-dependent receptor [Lysobacter sp. CAU 1642]MCK7592679.1 TonB-dependent receptor [Lysobacter sp. CAU 1642]
MRRLAHTPLLVLLPAALSVAAEPVTLETIVAVASRRPEPIAQVAAPVSIVEREGIEGQLMQDSADLARFVPGLRVDTDATRFGGSGFSLRGLGGNRVRVELDGVPLPETFSVGQFASASRDLADLELLERMEVLRGPASTLYGSDALAGIIALSSRDPDSVLGLKPEAQAVSSLRAGFSQRDLGLLLAAMHARDTGKGGRLLLAASRRDGEATQNLGEGPRSEPNPADTRRQAVLLRYAGQSDWLGEFDLIAEGTRGERQTDVVSQRFGAGRFASTTKLLADDSYQRERIGLSARWSFDDPYRHELALLAYLQQSEVTQDTAQTRNADRGTSFPSLRERRFVFSQDSLGVDLVASAAWKGAAFGHALLYGVELEQQDYGGYRDGVETNLSTGARSTVILGERFPVRDFPRSVARRVGLFAQDELRLGRWSLIPGLRYEHYRLDARPDATFREDFPNLEVVNDSAGALTTKLGLRFALTDRQQLFAQFAEGFRSPPFSDLNIGLSLPALNYEVRPNPALRDERSRGIDIGWRWADDLGTLSVTAFHNRYRDLIESRANLGTDPVSGALVFQSVNRQRARIEGIEIEGRRQLGERWTLRGAASWSRGDDLGRDLPLNSIDPARLSLGLAFSADSSRWGSELLATATSGKRRLDESRGSLFAPPGYTVIDLTAWWAPLPSLRIHAALNNLFDRRHWAWGTLRGLSADEANLGFYSQPGRTLSLRVAVDF